MSFVTGGAAFIGSNFLNDRLKPASELIFDFDKLTCSGSTFSIYLRRCLVSERHFLFGRAVLPDSAERIAAEPGLSARRAHGFSGSSKNRKDVPVFWAIS